MWGVGDYHRRLSTDHTAVFDTNCPRCSSVGTSCDSGTLLDGVAGYESNSPNTIDACGDTSLAVQGVDESLNRVHVVAANGETMRIGEDLTITVDLTTATDVSSRPRTNGYETLYGYYWDKVGGEWSKYIKKQPVVLLFLCLLNHCSCPPSKLCQPSVFSRKWKHNNNHDNADPYQQLCWRMRSGL